MPKRPHVDGRRQFSDIPDGMETVERVVTDEKIAAFRASIANELILAPLTKGGNLPFRRLCVERPFRNIFNIFISSTTTIS